MADAARVILGGRPLLASQPITWELREGVSPVIKDFPIRRSDRAFFRDPVNRRVTLLMEDAASNSSIVIRNLFVVDVQPGPNPHIDLVRVADRRIWWPYVHVLRRYNMRRKVGVFRPVSPNSEVSTPIVDDIAYWPWSLQSEVGGAAGKWALSDIIEDALLPVQEKEREQGGPAVNVGVRNLLPAALDDIPVENLEIDDAGDAAISRILGHLPGVGIFIDINGFAVIFDKTDGGERVLIDRPEIVDRGHVEFVDKRMLRPRAVRCWFSIEAEIRFDYVERSQDGEQRTRDPTEEDKELSRLLENVLPLPDFSLTDPAAGGDAHHAGTWLELADVMALWFAQLPPLKFPPEGSALTLNKMRLAAIPFIDLVSGIVHREVINADLHTARCVALMNHYRRTFRIPARWMNRFLSIRAFRVATIDVATGQRAPASIWCDYCYLRSQPAIFDRAGEANATDKKIGENVRGYPEEGLVLDQDFRTLHLNETVSQVPGRASINDQDQGIIEIDILTQPERYFSTAIPGFLETRNHPKHDIRPRVAGGDPIFFNASVSGGRIPQLESDWKCAVIFTAVPASPNSIQQLYPVTIENDDAALIAALPAHIRGDVRAANGPIMDVRIPQNVETARVAWSDKDAALIVDKVFGVGVDRLAPPAAGRTLAHLVTNLRIRPDNIAGFPPRHGDQFNELESIALSEAIRVYTSFQNRFEGTREMAFEVGPITMAGNMDALRFTVYPNGEFTTSTTLPTEGPRVSMFRFLDDGTRKLIMKLAKDPAAV